MTGSKDEGTFKSHSKTELLNLTTWEWDSQADYNFPGSWYHSGAAIYFDNAFYVTGGLHEKYPNGYMFIQKFVIKTKKWVSMKTGKKGPTLRLKHPRSLQSLILIDNKLGTNIIFSRIFITLSRF